MNNINSVNFNTSSNMQPGLGFNSGLKASALAAESRSSFGGFDIKTLASALIEALKTGTLPDGLLEMLVKVLSPVEAGQLLAAIAKLLSGSEEGGVAAETPQGGGGQTTAPSNAPASTRSTLAPTTTPTQAVPSVPTSDTRITTRAPDSANIPDLEVITNDPVVAAAIEKAWNGSNPSTPGAKQEQGFWVMRDDKTGALSTVNFPSNGTRDSLTPGAVPAIEGKTAVAFFHTHPNTAAEGYTNGPSPADQNFADARGIPGIIQSHNGLYYFNPTN